MDPYSIPYVMPGYPYVYGYPFYPSNPYIFRETTEPPEEVQQQQQQQQQQQSQQYYHEPINNKE